MECIVLAASGESPDQVVQRWWNDDVSWLDVPLVWVSAYCRRWRTQSLHLLHMRYPAATHAVIAAKLSPTKVQIHGVVLLADKASTVGEALHTHVDRVPTPAVPAIEWLTLDAVPTSRLAFVYANMNADKTWVQQTIDLMQEVAVAPNAADNAILRWGLSPEAQLASAKMRYLVKLCVANMPERLDPQKEAYALGLSTLGSWTEAYVRTLCTNHKRALHMARRFSLPFCAFDVPPRPVHCDCGMVPTPIFLSTQARECTQIILNLYKSNPACPAEWSRREKQGRSRVKVATGIPYIPDAPCALFIRGTASQLATWLALFLYESCLWPGNSTDIMMVEEADMFCIQDVIFSSGRALGQFVHLFSQRFALSLDTSIYEQPTTLQTEYFHAHIPVCLVPLIHSSGKLGSLLPPLLNSPKAPASPECGSAPLLLVDASLQPDWAHQIGPWSVYTPAQIGEWVRHCVERDVRTIHQDEGYLQRLGLEPLTRAVNPVLGSLLVTRLQAMAVQRNIKLNQLQDATADVVYTSKAYRHVEDYASANPGRLADLFRALVVGERTTETATTIRTAGLLFNIDGERKLRWKDFKLSTGGGHGMGLASLVGYRLNEHNPAVVLEWLQRWMDEYTRCGSGEAVNNAAPVRRITVDEEDRQRRERVERIVKASTRAVAPSRAHNYLRVARGLSTAPCHLIEENEHVGAIPAEPYYFGKDGPPPMRLPVVIFITESHAAVQVVYLDRKEGGGKHPGLQNPKKTHGYVKVSATQCDAVPICTPKQPGPYERVFLAEGPETALSVACAFPDAPVYAALGQQNFSGFHYAHARQVVVCMENDASTTREASRNLRKVMFKALRSRFTSVVEVYPPPRVGDRTISDFNDVHQARPGDEGTALVRDCIGHALKLPGFDTPPAVVDVMDE